MNALASSTSTIARIDFACGFAASLAAKFTAAAASDCSVHCCGIDFRPVSATLKGKQVYPKPAAASPSPH
jgi:hypothetical protein